LKPLCVLVGFIARLPYAGMSLWNLHYIKGLQQLGYDVHYVEKLMGPNECYDPTDNTMSDDVSYGLEYLDRLLADFAIGRERCSFVDLNGDCYGSGWDRLRAALDGADFVLNLGHITWFDDLARCPQRAFLDSDPLFTQAAMLDGNPSYSVLANYNVLFTEGTRLGQPDCTIPTAGREWIPTRTVIVSQMWAPAQTRRDLAVTALLHWAAGDDVVFDGRVYGHKDREFEQFVDLPRRARHRFAAAIGGPAPWDVLEEHGWDRIAPLDVTRTIDAYKDFIAGSYADFGVAKHAYVATRSGWFSDRSTCFLAAGRPVLHQDTGCGEWLPTGEGVLLFSDLDDAVAALAELDADYERHARAAREIAREHFEATVVLGRMLDDAGFR
jgi:hypothetical protein